jgi:hypothetical protein
MCPGFGDVRTALLLPIVVTPHLPGAAAWSGSGAATDVRCLSYSPISTCSGHVLCLGLAVNY